MSDHHDTQPEASTETRPSRSTHLFAKFWWIPIGGLLVAQIAVGVVTMIIATGDETFAVEPGYYEKAVAWDDSRDARRDPADLGWSMSVAVSADPDHDNVQQLRVRLFDTAEDTPVHDAKVSAQVFSTVRSEERTEIYLEPTAEPGVYEASFTADRFGMWEVRVGVDLSGERASRAELVELSS